MTAKSRLPSIDEIDFEIIEKPEIESSDSLKVGKRIDSVEKDFVKLRLELQHLKEKELSEEYSPQNYRLLKKKIADYEEKLDQICGRVEELKSSLTKKNVFLNRSETKSEFYKKKYLELENKFNSFSNNFSTTDQKMKELENKKQLLIERANFLEQENLRILGENQMLKSELEKSNLFIENEKKRLNAITKKSFEKTTQLDKLNSRYASLERINQALKENEAMLKQGFLNLKQENKKMQQQLLEQKTDHQQRIIDLKKRYDSESKEFSSLDTLKIPQKLDKKIQEYELKLQKSMEELQNLKSRITALTNIKDKMDKKAEYYKNQFVQLQEATASASTKLEEESKKIKELEKQNFILSENNQALQNRFLAIKSEHEKASTELDTKHSLFTEREEKIKSVTKHSAIALNELQTYKEKYEASIERNKELLKKAALLDYALAKLKERHRTLTDEFTKHRQSSKEQIDSVKQENEDRIKNIVQENTNSIVDLRTENEILNEKIEDLNRTIQERDRQNREFLSTVNTRFGFYSNQEVPSTFDADDSRTKDLISMIKMGLHHKDSIENIEKSLMNSGYTKKEIDSAFKKIKKK